MKTSTIRQVILLGAISILGILAFQVYLLIQENNQNEIQFHQSVRIALQNVAEQIADYNGSILPSQGLIKKVSSNYYVVNINDNIDANILEYYLQKEIEARHLDIDFEYGIYNCQTQEMEYGNYCTYEEGTSEPSGDLPVYKDFTYYFGVKFPTRSSYFFDELNVTMILSGLLVISLIFFVFSIYVILQQRRLSEMQRDFINNMTHEFKTPITSIKLASQVLASNSNIKEDPRLLTYSALIGEQTDRLNKQVEKVLNLAKFEKEQFKLNKESFPLHTLLMDIGVATKPQIEQNGGQIELNLNAKNDLIVADKLHLTNVLYNLLDNAQKYSVGNPQIKIETTNKGNELILKIKDNGIGIKKDDLKKIFKKFYRVNTGNVHDVKGFGLGLFYVKSICEAHNWKMNIESKVNKGTEIWITI